MKKRYLAIPLLVLGAAIFSYLKPESGAAPSEAASTESAAAHDASPYEVLSIEIAPQATFGVLMEEAGVPASTAAAVYETTRDIYDLASIRAGRTVDLYYPKDGGTLARLVYQIDTEDELTVEATDDGWTASRAAISYETRLRTVKGSIETSLYAAALSQGIDERAVIAMADVFQWDIDFAQDVRVGDTFKFIYEERWRDGKYVMPGNILAAKYVNAGAEKLAYFFATSDGEEGYFNQDGLSLRRAFLKAPLAFKYITSGFTTGLRYVAAFNTSTGHRAIDYAASAGTPVRTVGDGTVVAAGWNGPFGNFISVRHNGTFTTNYAHLSRIQVRRGQKVSQGQVIGNVGSTGFSTGPHLHYEMVKHGVKINPLREKFEAGDPIKDEDREAFMRVVEEWKDRL